MPAFMPKSILIVCAIIFGTLAISNKPQFARADTLTLSVASGTVDTVISEVIVKHVLQQLGVKVIYDKRRAARALKAANTGEVDGDVQRIDGLSGLFPNLVQLRPAINYIDGAAFSKQDDLDIENWEDLRSFSVGIIRGIKFAEKGTEGMNTLKVSSYRDLFELLNEKRVDVAIAPSLNGRYQLHANNFRDVNELSPPLQRFDLFLYLHKRHSKLIPAIEAEFQKLYDSGDLLRLRNHIASKMLEDIKNRQEVCDEDYTCFDPLPLSSGG